MPDEEPPGRQQFELSQPSISDADQTETSDKKTTKHVVKPSYVSPTTTAGSNNKPIVSTKSSSTRINAATSSSQSAPRQKEIASSIIKEYKYEALVTNNDPLSQNSWALENTRSPLAWETTTGNGAVIAIIDSGFALEHEDLSSSWYANDGENGLTNPTSPCWDGTTVEKATNNCDDDVNGYVDDYRGWDFVTINNSPQAGDTNVNGDGVSHGTETAGLAGASGNNGLGIATVSWNNKVMPLQALDDEGSGYTSDVVAAIYYAVDNGADVINMSLGGAYDDPALAEAVNYAYMENVVVVAAAGNCGSGQEFGCDPQQPGQMSYPALNPHVVSVGATRSDNTRASFSSYGPGLDITAPGSGTLASPTFTSSNRTSAYATSLYGTSYSSPIVASYAGLLKAIRPYSSPDDILALIAASAHTVDAMEGSAYTETYGHGIIDVDRGITNAGLLNVSTVKPVIAQTGSEFSEHAFRPDSSIASGCALGPNELCSIWAQNEQGYDRYLPYRLSDSEGFSDWTWAGSTLGPGSWNMRARTGELFSSKSYLMFQK